MIYCIRIIYHLSGQEIPLKYEHFLNPCKIDKVIDGVFILPFRKEKKPVQINRVDNFAVYHDDAHVVLVAFTGC